MAMHKCEVLCLLFLLVISCVSAQIRDLKKLSVTNENNRLPNKQMLSEPFNFSMVDEQTIENALSNSNATVECIQDVIYYVKNLVERTDWALQMFESNSVIPAGIFGIGNLHAEGLFDECLRVNVSNRFSGQYCTLFLKPQPADEVTSSDGKIGNTSRDDDTPFAENSLFVLPSVSVCVPSSCQAEDIQDLITWLFSNRTVRNQSLVPLVDERYCFKESDTIPIDAADIAVTALIATLMLLVLTGTMLEVCRNKESHASDDKWIVKFFLSFSVLTNGKKLLSFRVKANADNFSCIHGIRFFSTCWVVMGHVWIKIAASNTVNPNDLLQAAQTTPMQTIVNATVSVDTFFLVSGLLVAYFLMREFDHRKGKFNLGMFYLHRYLRLTPVYAVLLGIIATLAVHMGTGPNWYNVITAAQDCRRSWWKQLLYINNFFPVSTEGQCMGETWYLAVDMQLFVISPFFIYLIWKLKTIGLAVLAIAIVGSLMSNFIVFGYYELPPTLMPTRVNEMMTKVTDYMDLYYFKTWTRAAPYFIGIATGWVFHRLKGSKIAIPKYLVASMWMLSGATGVAIVYGLVPYMDETRYEQVGSMVRLTYGPLHRTAWALAVGWVIFACVHGHGGFINQILSWKGFLPLSRLTYCVYLIHYDYLNIFFAMSRRMNYYTLATGLTTFFGITVTVFLMAFVVAVTVEAPFMNVEKLLFTRVLEGKKSESMLTLQVEAEASDGQGRNEKGIVEHP